MAAKTLTPADLADRLFVTPNEAAAILQWDPRTVRRLIRDGTIPVTPGGYRIAAAWIREQAQLAGGPGELEALKTRVTELEATLARLREAFGGAV